MIDEQEIIEIISDLIKQDISTKLKEQGHNNTGSLLNSISYKITQTADSIITDFYMNNYGNIVDSGVKAYRIPYRRGSGAKKSKYIDGLINYFQSKGLSDAESKRAAFATANVHKKEGMPTKASNRFSKTGERIGFITNVIDSDNPYNIMLHEFGLKIDNYIDDLINILT